MELRNARGTPVDPVPLIVVVATSFVVCYAFGPAYLAEFGLPLGWSLTVSTGVFLIVDAAAYYRLVWTVRPDLRGEVSAEKRLRRYFLGTLTGIVLMLLLLLPLLATAPARV